MFFFSGLLVTSCATINTLEKKFWWRQICSLLLCNAKLLIKITSLEIGVLVQLYLHCIQTKVGIAKCMTKQPVHDSTV